MKYDIEDILQDETKKLDVSQFFPKAEEKVFVTIKRLPSQHQYHVTACMADGTFKGEKEYMEARKTVLLHGIVKEDFPLEKWDEEVIEKLEESKGQFLDFLINEISEFNRPLAQRKNEASAK